MEKEYQMLRTEIEINIKLMHNYVNVTCTVMVGILAFIAQTETVNTHIFALIFIALLVVANRVRSLLEANMRLSTYMEIILEPKINGHNWETFSHWKPKNDPKEPDDSENKQDKIYDRKKRRFNIIFGNQQTIYVIIGVITYIFYFITLKKQYENIEITDSVIGDIIFEIILFLFNSMVLGNLINFAKIDANDTSREDYKEKWIKVKNNQIKDLNQKNSKGKGKGKKVNKNG